MGKWFPTAFLYTPIYFACSFLQQSPTEAFTLNLVKKTTMSCKNQVNFCCHSVSLPEDKKS